MVDAFEALMGQYFWHFFAFCALWTVGGLGWMLYRRSKSNPFPNEPPRNIVYEEKMASGRSLKTWYTKLGGAQNCLKLIVSDEELWITPIFPFSALASIFDMDHRVRLDAISDLTERKIAFKEAISISYEDLDGTTHVVEVIPKNMDSFVKAIKHDE